ncbi:ComEA family DNA-binding protein [Halomonas sp. CUBES01]|uniref:ComEA family DNA-binding protein n=1 Tax=Vreelandella gomseomensis TaxID=370766 RepID=A0ABU1GDL8_9GAMM|nr:MULTISPECIES: ComEA family DNA-binding protein [Halomonas]MDR5875581.1 ComEA family DNA-binding protein [Halomonas gomseomensis]MEC4767782.1 ComEA family DNA-binding protein [Halomonas sp. CUBES01]
MKQSMKGLLAALLFSIGSVSSALAQEVAPININSADTELLDELPGIGPSRAEAIIEERDANGEFENADDLTRVSGIGPATVDRMRDQITFGN